MNIKDQLQKAPAKKDPNNPSVKDEPGELDTAKKRQTSRLIEKSEGKANEKEQINDPHQVVKRSDFHVGDSDSEYPAPEKDRSIYRDKSAGDIGSDTQKNNVPANDAGIYSEEDMEEEEGETDDLPDDVPNQQEGDAQLYKEAKKEPGYDPEY